MKAPIVAILVFVSSPLFAEDEPDNYCHDPAIWAKMNRLLNRVPEDPVIVRL